MPSLVPLSSNLDLVARVYDAILDAICSGEIGPDERLTQEALASRLGVSRQPVLQAIKLLEKDRLIDSLPNKKGFSASALTATSVSQLYLVRAVLDALAAKSAASVPRPDLLDAGITLLKQGRTAAQDGDLKALVLADLDFHQFVYAATGNPILIQTGQLHWRQTRRVMSTYLRNPAAFRSVWNEHQAILDAIVKGQARLAERLSRQHALGSVEFLFKNHFDSTVGATDETRRRTASAI
jgi:DNA-binding GntR family transcriptional regulator